MNRSPTSPDDRTNTAPAGTRQTAGRIVIGVAGGSGCGKTAVVNEIVHQLGEEHVTVIQHDWYYHDQTHLSPEQRAAVNYDHPDSLETSLLVEHLRLLRHGVDIAVPAYDFENHTRHAHTTAAYAKKVIIVEGILVLGEPALREAMDIRVFVDTDPDLRILRRLTRDTVKRGRTVQSVIAQYLSTVRPMHLEFVEPSKRHAHVIIPEGAHNTVGVDVLLTKIQSVVSAR